MRKGIVSFILILSIITIYSCSVYAGEWALTYGGANYDRANSIQQTADGGFIVAGWTGSYGAGGEDILIMKIDSNGSVVWKSTYGGNGSDWASSIQQTVGGGYVVAGGTGSYGAGGDDIWVLKLDAVGMIVWERVFGGTGTDWANSIQQTADGGYIVAGMSDSFGAGGEDIWILKLNADGDIVWQKTYGGNGSDWASSVNKTSDGGYIVAGATDSFGAGNEDIWILKIDGNGVVIWQKTYGGIANEWSNSILQTADGGYIVAGATDSFGAGSDDGLILKLDDNGAVSWQKTYGGTGGDLFSSIGQTTDSGYVVSGWTSSFSAGMNDMWVVKLDSGGQPIWQKTYGGQSYERAISAQQDANGGYVIAGGTWSFGAGSADFYVLKVDENGEIPNCSAISPSNSTVYTPSVQVNISDSVTTAADGLSNSTYAITTVPAASEMDGCFNAATGTGKLINISTRAMVQTGDGAEIAGFWIEGTAPKTVLIRARGPSMGSTPINLTGVLPNPSLTLYSGQTVIARNDDWQTSDPTCELNGYVCGGSAEISATGLDPCQPISGQMVAPAGCALESAILITLPPGGYTAIVSDFDDGTGIGLAEVFEADTVAESRLINISTRSRVETVDSVMIGGFWIGGGTGNKTVLIRARGPSLVDFGVPAPLANPKIQLYSGQTVIAQNDDWQTSDVLCGSPAIACGNATDIQNTGFDPCSVTTTGCTLDSALFVTLPPGGYSVILSGVSGGTGIGIVEVFEAD